MTVEAHATEGCGGRAKRNMAAAAWDPPPRVVPFFDTGQLGWGDLGWMGDAAARQQASAQEAPCPTEEGSPRHKETKSSPNDAHPGPHVASAHHRNSGGHGQTEGVQERHGKG